MDRMAVHNEKYRATGVVHQSLAEVDESGGFELTRFVTSQCLCSNL
jgi:hypothetical protein